MIAAFQVPARQCGTRFSNSRSSAIGCSSQSQTTRIPISPPRGQQRLIGSMTRPPFQQHHLPARLQKLVEHVDDEDGRA